VFIVLGGIQIVATTVIVVYAARYKDTPCPIHLPRQPTAKTATGTGTSGNEPSSWPPAGRSIAASATPAGHGGALRADVPVLPSRSHTVTTRPGPEADAQAVRSWPRPRIAAVSSPGSGRSPGGVARAHGTRALRERCRSYLRQCTGFPTTHLRGMT
jgi:hypothetical protein